ncbi:cysteine desulfurase family protein [Paenibacillus macquariensis]|uniref:cysteine desulfurase n=1 Tax=Paenibacillus macquariensis TaxID=948756 RepID=A0ABY1K200_9BACL|nr:cysteine desulfurase family protein [Paenibacillus macquariensis]MEC0091676.1 cysteine desulfurase family protein [Paenibacillus macquariensis]OAB32396.1 cysteine desulfurase NifS [Paenibacillus macquariensis subsp. macquariensis]SIR14203.1 cysteine desulfurase [Paenibacillus macquariensis]
MNSIYLDHAASTPIHPEVASVMMKIMTEQYGNASSVHTFGRSAKRMLNGARDQVCALLDCYPDELVFTGGGTESDNLALFGVSSLLSHKGKHIITSSIEHHAILHTCDQLEREGFQITYLPVDATGQISLSDLEDAITEETILISIMYGNNEVGTIQPIKEIGELARSRGILFHVDAVQALGAVPISCKELAVDLMSFSAHKVNGPQGVGALYVRRGLQLNARLYGGLQEKKRRAGTENIAGVVGFAKAIEIMYDQLKERTDYYVLLRSTLLDALAREVGRDFFIVNGHSTEFLPHILNISFPEIDSETLLMSMDMEGIAASSGSACTSGSLELSHVLKAMNLPEQILKSAVRFSYGLGNTTEEMECTARIIGTILQRIRKRDHR